MKNFPNITTKTGDTGQTSLYSGGKVSKTSINIKTVAQIDLFSSSLGLCHKYSDSEVLDSILKIQDRLTLLMGEVATSLEKIPDYRKKKKAITEVDIKYLEDASSNLRNYLSGIGYKLNPWVLYGEEGEASAYFDYARAYARMCEISLWELADVGYREMLAKYFNRLSDYLFLLGRYVSTFS